ncbi:MAG: hypothetical protein DDT22_01388 [candidate division WS2 bacterium]|nr:hypothetical protein [Candidatus Lithacetigena glycinireducens]
MSKRMLEKKGLVGRRIIFTLLVALTLLLSFVGTTYADPSDDDSRVKSIQPVVEVRSNP